MVLFYLNIPQMNQGFSNPNRSAFGPISDVIEIPQTSFEIQNFEWRDLTISSQISPFKIFHLDTSARSYSCYSPLHKRSKVCRIPYH